MRLHCISVGMMCCLVNVIRHMFKQLIPPLIQVRLVGIWQEGTVQILGLALKNIASQSRMLLVIAATSLRPYVRSIQTSQREVVAAIRKPMMKQGIFLVRYARVVTLAPQQYVLRLKIKLKKSVMPNPVRV